jgi:hypothetical protein
MLNILKLVVCILLRVLRKSSVQHTEIYYHQKEITQLQCKSIFQQNLSQTEHNTKIRTNSHKNSQHFRGSETQTRTLRIKNEIKFLYKKKQHLNKELYNLHIQNANEWGNIWNIITNETTNTINETMKHKYIKITKKLHKLKNYQCCVRRKPWTWPRC